VTNTPTTIPKPLRRWFQYSLRTLLVLMLVFGCGFGWLGMKVKQAREQREAVETTEERAMLTFGGTYRVNWPPKRV
jgi:hypothetical protein